ncbi:hypothetical protein BJY04DRAFT_217209 [Aspergillus karnatakaensis]|uniref:uncharacterized protein n=1 Tax=Aspergillus karnatakaensis TaxID=1810916 RepID=UPI003CCCFFAD
MDTVRVLLQTCLHRLQCVTVHQDLAAIADERPPQAWEDELGRLRVWAASVCVDQDSDSVLDDRLFRAAEHTTHVIKLLTRLDEILISAEQLLNGDCKGKNAEREASNASDDEDEMYDLYDRITSTVSNLNLMGTVMRNPALSRGIDCTEGTHTEAFELETLDKKPVSDNPLASHEEDLQKIFDTLDLCLEDAGDEQQLFSWHEKIVDMVGKALRSETVLEMIGRGIENAKATLDRADSPPAIRDGSGRPRSRGLFRTDHVSDSLEHLFLTPTTQSAHKDVNRPERASQDPDFASRFTQSTQ